MRAVYLLVAMAAATQLACGGQEQDPRCAEIKAKAQQCFPESELQAAPQCAPDLLDNHGIIMHNSCEALFNIGKGDGDRLIPLLLGGAALGLGGAWVWNKYTSCQPGMHQPKCDSGMSSQVYMDNYPMGGSISVCYQGKVAHKRCLQGCQTGPQGPFCVEDGPYGTKLYGGSNAMNCQQLPQCFQGCGNCQQTTCGWKCMTGNGWQQNAWQQNNSNWQSWEQDNSDWIFGGQNNWEQQNQWQGNNHLQQCQQLPPCYQGCQSNCRMTPCGPKCAGGIFNAGGQNIDPGLCMQACQQCNSGWSCPQQMRRALGLCYNQGYHCGGNNFGNNFGNNNNNWFI